MAPRGSHTQLTRLLEAIEEVSARVDRLEAARKSDSAAVDQLHTEVETMRGQLGGNMDAEVWGARFDALDQAVGSLVEHMGEPLDPVEAVDRKLDALLLRFEDPAPVPPATAEARPAEPWPWYAYVSLGVLLVVLIAMLLGQLGEVGQVVGSLPVERVLEVGE